MILIKIPPSGCGQPEDMIYYPRCWPGLVGSSPALDGALTPAGALLLWPPSPCAIMAAEGGDFMPKLEFNGIDDVLDALENEPFNCTCSVCGQDFQATQEQLLQPTVTCPHCGAELEEL